MRGSMKPLLLLPVLALFSACTVNTYCEGEQDYAKAESLPPVRSAEGVKVPESQSALRIPPPPKTAVPYGEPAKDEDGDDIVRCLDQPPNLPPPAAEAAPAPAAPAPAPVPEEKPS
jgi:hypothetical protein